MGTNAQVAADTSSFMGTAGDNRLRNVASEQASSPRVTSNITVQMAVTAAVAGACSQRSATATAAITDQSSGIVNQNVSTQSNQLLQSLTQHTSVSRSARTPASATLSGNIRVTRSSATAVTRHDHCSTSLRVLDTQRVSRLMDCCPAQVIATPSAIDSVKRMECDSSVPSPPKNQQQQQTTAAMFNVVPTGVVGIHRTVPTAVLSQPSLSPKTTIHAPAQTQTPILLAATVPCSERRFSNDRISTAVSNCSTFTASNALPTAMTAMNMVTVTSASLGSVPSTALPQAPMLPTATSTITQERPMEELQRGILLISFCGKALPYMINDLLSIKIRSYKYFFISDNLIQFKLNWP